MILPEDAGGGGDDNDNSDSDNDDDDRVVMANRPDIIIANKKRETRILIDLPIPVDRNAMQEGAETNIIQEFMIEIN